jgi:hypothetical protein
MSDNSGVKCIGKLCKHYIGTEATKGGRKPKGAPDAFTFANLHFEQGLPLLLGSIWETHWLIAHPKPNVEVTGAARLYRAASGGPQG